MAMDNSIANKLLTIELRLASELSSFPFGKPVRYVYNPIDYAFDVHSTFVNRFCTSRKKIMFLGMNAGPWGMAQTGVPFGEVNAVRDWLKVEGIVNKPHHEHPKRPVTGLACRRSEVSGKRFWALFKDVSGQPDTFFRDAFVYNHCPVAFLAESGNNITVPELKLGDRKQLTSLCDQALGDVLVLLGTEVLVAIGKFAEQRAKCVVDVRGLSCRVCSIAHPSPRNCGVKDWPATAAKQLTELGLMPFLQPG